MYWTFNCFLGCLYIFLLLPTSDFQILNFDVWKKRLSCPNWGQGGVFRWYGQCPKEYVFHHWCLPLCTFLFSDTLSMSNISHLMHLHNMLTWSPPLQGIRQPCSKFLWGRDTWVRWKSIPQFRPIWKKDSSASYKRQRREQDKWQQKFTYRWQKYF